MKRLTKFKCCGIVSAVIGVILLGLGIGWPFIIDSVVTSQSKEQAALGKDNMDQWKDIPGKFDIQLNRKMYLYNVVNKDAVVFQGAKPIAEEHGPFIYRETDNYSTPVEWDVEVPVPSNPTKKAKAIRMFFNQTAKLNDGVDFKKLQAPDLDIPIWQINQAALGVWFAATNPPEWRLAINLLYSVVVDGLGRQVVATAVYAQISGQCSDGPSVSSYLFTDAGISDDQATAIATDPDWGTNNPNNLIRWEPLTTGSDPMLLQALINEFKMRFGLTYEQILVCMKNWNDKVLLGRATIMGAIPSQNHDLAGIAYAQWADSQVTSLLGQPSVALASDTVTGYPEFADFKKEKFDKAIAKNDGLSAKFRDLKMYVGWSAADIVQNYEYLFAMDDKKGGDPLPNSLFNVQTIQALIASGKQTIDVIEKPDTNVADLDLKPMTDVAATLKLSGDQTYMVYMWLKYVNITTFQRQQDSALYGGKQLGVMSQLSSQAMSQMMYQMEQEVPLIVYTYQFSSLYDATKTNCHDFYKTNFVFDEDLIANLCGGGILKINTFDFSNPLETSKAWMNIALNNNTFLAHYYADLVYLSGKTCADLDTLIFLSTSKFQKFIQKNVFQAVYAQYPDACTLNVQKKVCTNRELTYQQWLDQSILAKPLAPLPATTDSYVTAFPDFTKLTIRPELSFYLSKAGLKPFDVKLSDCMTFFQTNRLYNLEIIGDIIISKTNVDYARTFMQPQMVRYIQYVMIEVGLGGLFQYRTPREYIEGFIDPTVWQVSQIPMWNGGDQTNDPFMSLNESPTNPKNNPIMFFTGKDDYKKTRSFAKWLDLDYITLQRKDYASIYTLEDQYQDPWGSQLPLDGTDGFQFHPDLQESDELKVWVNDLGRNGYFNYLNDDYDAYDGLRMMTYQISPKLMQKANPDNKIYGTFLDGTSPMFKVLQAPVLASKGHFYQIDEDAKTRIASMVDQKNNPINPVASEDDTFLGMEQNSGVNVQARQRLQMNFYIQKDLLFNFIQDDKYYITPLTFIKRESIMSQHIVSSILGPLYIAKTARKAGLGVLISIGGLLIILAAFLLYRYRKIRIQEEMGVFDKEEVKNQGKIQSETLISGDLSNQY